MTFASRDSSTHDFVMKSMFLADKSVQALHIIIIMEIRSMIHVVATPVIQVGLHFCIKRVPTIIMHVFIVYVIRKTIRKYDSCAFK
jgi:hypothetical protein